MYSDFYLSELRLKSEEDSHESRAEQSRPEIGADPPIVSGSTGT